MFRLTYTIVYGASSSVPGRYIDQMRGDSTSGVLPTVCYLQAAGSLLASFATLCVTLRYKRLISKNQKIRESQFSKCQL